jgi:hypothetical protein
MSIAVVAALVAGVICGLFPLVYGLTRGRTSLAAGGFVACVVGGFILGLILAVPMAVLFCWLIHRRSRVARPAAAAAGAANEPMPARPEAVGPASGDARFERAPDRGADREPTARA